MANSPSSTSKAKPSGCGLFNLIKLGLTILVLKTFYVNTPFPLSEAKKTMLEEKTEQVRSQFQAGACDQLYQDFHQETMDTEFGEFSDDFNKQTKINFAEVCGQVGDHYRQSKSIELTESTCETTRTIFNPIGTTQCVLFFKVMLADNQVLRENFTWLLKGKNSKILNANWSEPQVE
jgi:hypothetical protein